MRSKQARYTDAFKLAAVARLDETDGWTAKKRLAKSMGVPLSTLYHWRKQAKAPKPAHGGARPGAGRKPAAAMNEAEAQIRDFARRGGAAQEAVTRAASAFRVAPAGHQISEYRTELGAASAMIDFIEPLSASGRKHVFEMLARVALPADDAAEVMGKPGAAPDLRALANRMEAVANRTEQGMSAIRSHIDDIERRQLRALGQLGTRLSHLEKSLGVKASDANHVAPTTTTTSSAPKSGGEL